MKDDVPAEILGDEWLARFILSSRHVRASDMTVKSDAFIPHPYPDLSVTRHVGLSQQRLWQTGKNVAAARPAKLYGRADLQAARFRHRALVVTADPTEDDPNHAIVTGWPSSKSAQKSIAQELAAVARFTPAPE